MVKILLVEDEPAHIELIRRAFQDRVPPVDLVVAHGIQQARAHLDSHTPSPELDLVITDWLLPDGHGIEILDHLQDPPCCPTVVMTSHGNEQVAVEAMKAGALDYVVKSAETLADMPHIAERALREWQHIAERRRAEARISHLNAVLNAIRSVNRLITRERDYQTLVKEACQCLIQTRGYRDAWIALIQEQGRPSVGSTLITAQAGPTGNVLPIIEQLDQNSASFANLPWCVKNALQHARIQALVTTDEPCTGCPLLAASNYTGTLIGRMTYDNKTYGLLSVTIPVEAAADLEEQELFKEMLDDLAFALHSIEQEKARQQFEAQFLQAQKMEAVGRLAGSIAHDFNNLLTAITGYAELLLLQLASEDPKYQDVKEITKAAERSAALTRQLLIFSRKQAAQPTTLELNRVTNDMKKMLRRLIGEDIELNTFLCSEPVWIKADQGQIEQVLMNLVVNARDAMPLGGKLTIETKPVLLDAQHLSHETYLPDAQHTVIQNTEYQDGIKKPHHYIMLEVRDTGVGMSQETKSHLFEPFFTTKEEGKGTGLGLATVYGIVKQSQGRIWFSSELDQGATFRIYFPSIDLPQDQLHQKRTSAELADGTETILLVEDEEAVRLLAKRILQHSGYTVLESTNAQNAILQCHGYPDEIDLVITDVIMPGQMNGKEMAEHLMTLYPNLKTIYMSGYSDKDVIQQEIITEGLPFIQKPFDPASLTYIVRQVLDAA